MHNGQASGGIVKGRLVGVGGANLQFTRAYPEKVRMVDLIGLTGAGHDTKWNEWLLFQSISEVFAGEHELPLFFCPSAL
jgi:hypothetical protein